MIRFTPFLGVDMWLWDSIIFLTIAFNHGGWRAVLMTDPPPATRYEWVFLSCVNLKNWIPYTAVMHFHTLGVTMINILCIWDPNIWYRANTVRNIYPIGWVAGYLIEGHQSLFGFDMRPYVLLCQYSMGEIITCGSKISFKRWRIRSFTVPFPLLPIAVGRHEYAI